MKDGTLGDFRGQRVRVAYKSGRVYTGVLDIPPDQGGQWALLPEGGRDGHILDVAAIATIRPAA